MRYLIFFVSFLSLTAWSQQVDESNELLWEITGNGAKTSYLFGSIHTNDRRVFHLSDSTYFAMEKADVISIEADIFSIFDWLDTRVDDVDMKYDNKGKPYSTSREATATVYGDEDGMPQFLDAWIQQYCYNSEKHFVPLETVESQMNLFGDADYRPNLKNLNYQSFLTGKEELIEIYLTGDIYSMNDYIRNSLSIMPDMYDDLIVKRNIGMANKLDSLIRKQNVFCAVGAGHLAGGGGVISLLRSKGYSVRKVTASFSETRSNAKSKVLGARQYKYENDTLGIYAVFPGKPVETEDDFEEIPLKLIYRDLGQGNSYEIEVYDRTEEIGLEELADIYIPSPANSPYEKIILDNGGEAYQGLGQSYLDGTHWVRVIMSESVFVVIKAYGGNKFMSSPRPFRFFDNVWLD